VTVNEVKGYSALGSGERAAGNAVKGEVAGIAGKPLGGKAGGAEVGPLNAGFKFADGVAFESDIAAHITKFDGFSQARGIGGAHNLDEFMDAATKNNVRIISQTPGDAPGISTIKYQIPAIDRAGNVALDTNGGVIYKNADFAKTVYDPIFISDRSVLGLGQQAASSGYTYALENRLKAYNAEAGGISFRIYIDPNSGLITNFHPR
jgi:filamentous hemagglutinin